LKHSEKIRTELAQRNSTKSASVKAYFKKLNDLQLRDQLVNLNVKINKMLRAKATYETHLEEQTKQLLNLILKQYNYYGN